MVNINISQCICVPSKPHLFVLLKYCLQVKPYNLG